MVVIDLFGFLAVLPGGRDGKVPIQERVVVALLGSFGCGVGVVDDVERVKEPVNFLTALVDFIPLDIDISLVGMIRQKTAYTAVQGHIWALWCIRFTASFADPIGLDNSTDLLEGFI